MALINHRAREIHFKIVFYGPGLGGKTTNLQVLHERLPAEKRGKLLSVATDHERTLFFDFLPVDLGTINGLLTRFHLYTVPGQVYYRLSRRAVLQGADGIVFVADSHPAREQANLDSLADLAAHLKTLGLDEPGGRRLPRIVQYNKRDLPLAVPIERMRAVLNPEGAPEFEAIAKEGRGVTETLRAACKAVLARLASVPVQETKKAVAPPAGALPKEPARAGVATAISPPKAAPASLSPSTPPAPVAGTPRPPFVRPVPPRP